MTRNELRTWLSINLTPDEWPRPNLTIDAWPRKESAPKLPATFAWSYDEDMKEWVVAMPEGYTVTKGDVWATTEGFDAVYYAPENNRSTIRQDVLEDAMACVLKDRDDQYGEPEDSFGKIAEYWSAYLESDVSARDVGLMLALMKIARMRNSDKRDNFIDLAGYAACAAECKYG